MPEKVKTLSWNVHFPKFADDCGYVIDLLERENPDIICLQEYVDGKDAKVKSWLVENDYSFDYLPFGFDKIGKFSQGSMTAVKQRLAPETEIVQLREDEPRRFRNFPNTRGLLVTSVGINSTSVEIINTHLTLARPWTSDMRVREFQKMKDYLCSREANNSLILGDFNFLPVDNRRDFLKEFGGYFSGGLLNKTWRWRGLPTPIQANIDAVFWDNEKLTVNGRVLPLEGYDHCPLLLNVEVSNCE